MGLKPIPVVRPVSPQEILGVAELRIRAHGPRQLHQKPRVPADVPPGQEGGLLEDDPEKPPSPGLVGASFFDGHFPLRGVQKARDHLEQRALPAPGRADERDELPLVDVQMDVLHRGIGLPSLGLVGDGDVFQLDDPASGGGLSAVGFRRPVFFNQSRLRFHFEVRPFCAPDSGDIPSHMRLRSASIWADLFRISSGMSTSE